MGAEDELVRLFEKASKAADAAASDDSGSAEESRCVEAIKVMYSFPVTTVMLVSTQIGKRLRRLTKHARPKIQKAASDLLEGWKKTVAAETKNGAIESSPSESASKKSLPPSVKSQKNIEKVVEVMETRVKEESVVVSNTVSVSTVKVESQRTEVSKDSSPNVKDSSSRVKTSNSTTVVKTREVKPLNLALLPKTKDSTRDKLRESLAEALARVLSESEGKELVRAKSRDPIGVAVAVETVMFESLGGFHGVNKMKYRSIMFNIKDANNPDFRRKILLGDLNPGEIINLTPDEMASDQRKMENEEIKKKALFECERGTACQASTDQFKCGKCGRRECTYYQLQTRSADEPMTTYVTCVNCNNRWKFC